MKRRGMKFRDWVAQQGMNMVAVWDSHHDENAQRHRWPEDDRYFALWVTLQGSVHRGWYDIPGEDPKPPAK
jgi:hypothetical protein